MRYDTYGNSPISRREAEPAIGVAYTDEIAKAKRV